MKENANPTVYNVAKNEENRGEDFYKNLIASEPLSRFGFDPRGSTCTLDASSMPTPVERSVRMALSAIHEQWKRDGAVEKEKYDPINILKISGMFHDDTSGSSSSSSSSETPPPMQPPNVFQQCYFLPSQSEFDTASGKTKGKSQNDERRKKRDPIEPEEVFDIIRNIQDPEHPLTLEQLNVVNLKHVSVKDISVDPDGGDDFSTVDVKFT